MFAQWGGTSEADHITVHCVGCALTCYVAVSYVTPEAELQAREKIRRVKVGFGMCKRAGGVKLRARKEEQNSQLEG